MTFLDFRFLGLVMFSKTRVMYKQCVVCDENSVIIIFLNFNKKVCKTYKFDS